MRLRAAGFTVGAAGELAKLVERGARKRRPSSGPQTGGHDMLERKDQTPLYLFRASVDFRAVVDHPARGCRQLIPLEGS